MLRKNPALFYEILILLVLLAYGASLANGFVYDDDLVITKNHFIRSFSHVKDFFRSIYFPASGELSYRPVVTFSYFLDFSVFRLAGWGYHLHNLLVHLGVVLSLVWLLGNLGLKGWPVWIASALFAVHPAAVESVVSPANREELYCAFFMILSLGFFVRRRLFFSCLFFLLSLFTKETAAVLPILFAGWWFFCGRSGDRTVRRLFPAGEFAAVLAVLSVYAMVRFILMHNPLEDTLDYRGGTVWSNLFAHARGWGRMLFLFILPVDLNVDHAFHADPARAVLGAVLSCALVAALILAMVLARRRAPVGSVGLLWMLCTFLPVAGFLPIANIFAERFLYIPLAGFAMAVAGFGEALRERLGKAVVLALMLWIAVLGVMTQQRAAVWKNGETLWADALEKNPGSARAHNNLGYALLDTGTLEAAKKEFEAALALDPRMAEAWRNLGSCYDDMGDYAKSAECIEKALEINPQNPEIFITYGDALFKMKRWDEAEKQYRTALSMRPYFAEAWNNLGLLLFETGRKKEARDYLERALKLIPAYPDALCNLGTVLADGGDLPAAVVLWKKALKIKPYHQGAQANLRRAASLLAPSR